MITSVMVAQEITLPALRGFKMEKNYPVFNPGNLWDFIDGAADNYLSYDFLDLHVAEYRKWKNVIKLEVYHHKNDIMAFGIYSSERSPSFNFIGPGTQGYTADGSINFYKGDYYVKIRTYSQKEKVLKAAETLAREVAEMLPGDNHLPAALSIFPAEGRKRNEETFINKNVLGHKFLTGAFKANYSLGPDDFSVYILKTESTGEAKDMVESYLKSAGIEPSEQAGGKYILTDGYNGTIFLTWKDNTVVLISGLAKDQADIADKYISQIIK